MATATAKSHKPTKPPKPDSPTKRRSDTQSQRKYIDKKIAKERAALAPVVVLPDMMPFKVQSADSVEEILALNGANFMNWVFQRIAQRAAGAGGLYDDLGDKLILMMTHKLTPKLQVDDNPPGLKGTPKEQMRVLQRVMDTIGTPDAQYTEVKDVSASPSHEDIGPRPDLAPARAASDDDTE